MKIIGETGGGYICEISRGEVANLIGYHSEYSSDNARPKIGAVITINEMYHQLYQVKDIKRQVAEIVKASSAIADAVRIKMPVIEAIVAAIEGAEPKAK